MKKLLALLLAAVLVLSLAACGNKKQEESGTVAVYITVNPEFKLLLDDSGKIVLAEALNGDGNAVIKAVQLVGKSCEDGIILLLKETAQQGYLRDGSEVKVTMEISDNIANQLDKWHKTVIDSVSKALSASNVTAAISFDSQITRDPSSSNPPPQNDPTKPNHQGNQNQPTIDANGNKITVDANGNTRIEQPDGTVSVMDKNGKPILVMFTEADGTRVTQYHTNGVIEEELREFTDGSKLTNFFDANGRLVREVRVDAGGKETVQEFDNLGNQLPEGAKQDANGVYYYPDFAGQSRVFIDENGDSWNNTYDAQGYIVESYREWTDPMGFVWRDYMETRPDGSRGAVTYHLWNGNWEPKVMYHPNGVVSKEVLGQSGHGLSVGYYNTDGALTDVYGWDNFDCPNHLVYNADGSYVCYTTEPDGSVSTAYYDANGNEIHP